MTNDKQNIKSGNPIPGILATIGIITLLGASGTKDAADTAEYENQRAGYEKNITYSTDTKKSDRTLLLGSILTGAGVIGLLRKEYYGNDR